MVRVGNHLYVASRDHWRTWLQENHGTEKEIWLIHYKKHTAKPSISYEEAVEEALCFGWIDSIMKSLDDEKYALRYSPRKRGSIWSEANKRRVERMISQGLMTEAGMAKIREAKESGEWQKATVREDTTNIPPDLEEALRANEKARHNFEGLAPSY
jgi:uncharacterized protein YdeI (YjbR/CyaY-like superfamily)